METGIAFVILVLSVISADGKLETVMRAMPACPPEEAIQARLEEEKTAGKIKDYYVNCTVPLRPVEQRGADDGAL
jgi:hypothetical protein